jgi:mono/diheme cytochrome c family protein
MRVPLTLLLLATAPLAAAQDAAPDGGPARIFQKRCASCHTVPDVKFETDRAWLGQILRTA